MTLMYDAATPPVKFTVGEPWAGYLRSVHGFAVWPVQSLKDAVKVGLLPIWGGPLDLAAFEAANAADEAHAAVAQVKALGGGRITVALDIEERAYESAPEQAVAFVRAFGQAVKHEGGLTAVYSGPALLDKVAPFATSCELLPWVAEWTTHPGYPVPGYGQPRAWQYAGNVHHGGKLVDISTIEAGFPLIHLKADPHSPTRLHLLERRAVRRLNKALPHRTHPVAAKDRAAATECESELRRTLAL